MNASLQFIAFKVFLFCLIIITWPYLESECSFFNIIIFNIIIINTVYIPSISSRAVLDVSDLSIATITFRKAN